MLMVALASLSGGDKVRRIEPFKNTLPLSRMVVMKLAELQYLYRIYLRRFAEVIK